VPPNNPPIQHLIADQTTTATGGASDLSSTPDPPIQPQCHPAACEGNKGSLADTVDN
jgi:hypothetical protein